MSKQPCFALVLVLGLISVVFGAELVEWPLNLFDVANANKNAECNRTEFLQPPGHYAGYFEVSGTKDGHLSYMYFENRLRDPDAPLVFWTNGGPGCSSYFGLFLENGPYSINDDLSLCWTEYGWDIGHNIIFVEQPINVGYSYSKSPRDRVFSEDRVGSDMVAFFHAFIEKHPELEKKDFYITGESFAGHYLPNIAKAIIESNAHDSGPQLNLKGVLLVNPWINPASMYYSYPRYAYQEKLVGKSTRDLMISAWNECDRALQFCDMRLPVLGPFLCNSAYAYCQLRLFQPVLLLHPKLNYYDIRRRDCTRSMCYDTSLLERFLNDPKIKSAMGVKSSIKWTGCDDQIRRDMGWDVATDSSNVVSSLLNMGLNFSVAVGDRDLICNYMGNERWTDHLKWNKDDEWAKTAPQSLKTRNGGGYVRQVTPFSFVKVEGSGHMIPMDQPALGLELLTAFTRGQNYPTTGPTSLPTT